MHNKIIYTQYPLVVMIRYYFKNDNLEVHIWNIEIDPKGRGADTYCSRYLLKSPVSLPNWGSGTFPQSSAYLIFFFFNIL